MIQRAYDLDGTICGAFPKRPKPYFKQTGPEREAFDKMLQTHCAAVEVIRQPSAPYIIITSRQSFLRDITETWIKKNLDVQPEAIYFIDRPRTRQNMIEFKTETVKAVGAKVYFEDDPKIAKGMAKSGVNVCLMVNKKKEPNSTIEISASREHLAWPFKCKKNYAAGIVEKIVSQARRPVVSFSGGLHSCILLELVREIKPTIEVFTVDLGLAFPDQASWAMEYVRSIGLNWLRFAVPDWKDDDEFLQCGIVFKGLQHVPRKDWTNLGINAKCRGVRKKWERRLLKQLGVDYVFTGILGDEKPARMKWWLKDGYVKEKHPGCWHVKPIAHYTMNDCQQLAETRKVPYYEKVYRDCGKFRQGDMGCWMCTVRLRNSSAGNLGFLSRNYPKLFRKLMYDFNGAEQLKAIQIAYPKPWLGRFIEEYL